MENPAGKARQKGTFALLSRSLLLVPYLECGQAFFALLFAFKLTLYLVLDFIHCCVFCFRAIISLANIKSLFADSETLLALSGYVCKYYNVYIIIIDA